jgi:hypothetical protein
MDIRSWKSAIAVGCVLCLIGGCGGGSGSGAGTTKTVTLDVPALNFDNAQQVNDLVQQEAATGVTPPLLQQILDGYSSIWTPEEKNYLSSLILFSGTPEQIMANADALNNHLVTFQGRVGTFTPPAAFGSDWSRVIQAAMLLPLNGGLTTTTNASVTFTYVSQQSQDSSAQSLSRFKPLQSEKVCYDNACLDPGYDVGEETFNNERENCLAEYTPKNPNPSEETKNSFNNMYIACVNRAQIDLNKFQQAVEKNCEVPCPNEQGAANP